MSDEKPWRLWIDGVERTDECADLDFGTPALVYDVPHDGRWARHVVGPRGFWLALTGPSERLRALAHDGQKAHEIRIAFGSNAIPVPVQFHEEWVEESGLRRMFGCLAHDRNSGPMWVTEPQLAEA